MRHSSAPGNAGIAGNDQGAEHGPRGCAVVAATAERICMGSQAQARRTTRWRDVSGCGWPRSQRSAGATGIQLGGLELGQSSGAGGVQGQGTTPQTGSNNTIFGNTGVGGQTFGGGAIVGVASKSKDLSIRIYNKKKTYDEWVFIYSPRWIWPTCCCVVRTTVKRLRTGNKLERPRDSSTRSTQERRTARGIRAAAGRPWPAAKSAAEPATHAGSQFPPDQSQPH